MFYQSYVSADQEKGRLRTFLLGSLQNFLFNEYDRARALKRGGSHRIVSIDEHLPEAEAAMIDTAHLDDSRCYDQVWAANIVKRARHHLQNAFEAEEKAESLEVLRPFVAGGGLAPPNQEEAAIGTIGPNTNRISINKTNVPNVRAPRLVYETVGVFAELNITFYYARTTTV